MPYFQRRFSGFSFSLADINDAAEGELRAIDQIMEAEKPAKEKSGEIWRLIKGKQA